MVIPIVTLSSLISELSWVLMSHELSWVLPLLDLLVRKPLYKPQTCLQAALYNQGGMLYTDP